MRIKTPASIAITPAAMAGQGRRRDPDGWSGGTDVPVGTQLLPSQRQSRSGETSPGTMN
jgi:hypothetical protein